MIIVRCPNCRSINLFTDMPPARIRCDSCGNTFPTAGRIMGSPASDKPKPSFLGCIVLVVIIVLCVMAALSKKEPEEPKFPPDAVLTVHPAPIQALAISPDSGRVLIAGDDGSLRLWDLGTRQEILAMKEKRKVSWIAFSTDGRRALGFDYLDSLSKVKTLAWDLETGHCVEPNEVDHYRTKFEHSSDNRFKINPLGSDVQLWDGLTNTLIRTVKGHTKQITSLGFLPDGQHFMSSSEDGTVRKWNMENGQEVRRFDVELPVQSFHQTPDGRRLVIIATDPTPHFLVHRATAFDFESGKGLRTFKYRGDSDRRHVALAPNGRQLLICGYDKSVQIWNIPD